MSVEKNNNWYEANQQYLTAALSVVQEEMVLLMGNQSKTRTPHSFIGRIIAWLKSIFSPHPGVLQTENALEKAIKHLEYVREKLPTIAALDRLVQIFHLSSFERKILLMCAGVELDAQFGKRIAAFNNGQTPAQPTFSLALAAFKDAHWSALSPTSPLRYWLLVNLGSGTLVTKNTLKIDESVLHYLTGVSYLDDRLREILEPVFPEGYHLSYSQAELVNRIHLTLSTKSDSGVVPIVQLTGDDKADKTAIALAVCGDREINLYRLSVHSIPSNTKETGELVRLWNREAALKPCALLIEDSLSDPNDKLRGQLVTHFIENTQGLLILSGGEGVTGLKRPKIVFAVGKPTSAEQIDRWEKKLGDVPKGFTEGLADIVAQFDLSTQTIDDICLEIKTRHPALQSVESDVLIKEIWKSCVAHTRPKIEELAQRIEPVATWKDIVLPEAQTQILKDIAMQVRHRKKVYNDWGFAKMGSRGLGISALFSGESGTGKTMASEVLANELDLDLYRIDLSQVVNKYIGETEKNLKRIFDAAEGGGAILLFDEADALFGKRSDVKDSHDRYSNIEVSYLLQRMESYSGLAVLTTNMRNAIDKAFLRRIRFVAQFSYPDAKQRKEIWQRIFPKETPTQDLDFEKLSKLNVTGGNIRNIALNAAFIAAEAGQPVRMSHILQAVRSEYNKLEKTLSTSEIAGW